MRALTQRPGTRARLRGDDGTAVVEAAIITPVLLFIIFGVFEFGLAFRTYLALGDATADAVRSGAVWGNDELDISAASDGSAMVNGDYAMVAALREGLGSVPVEAIERIVIFKGLPPGAGSAIDQVPSACRTATNSVSGARPCNVYPAREAFYAVQGGNSAYFECGGSNTRACAWNPEDRVDGPNPPLDYVGVYVEVNHQFVTGAFGNNLNLDTAAIARLEPGASE